MAVDIFSIQVCYIAVEHVMNKVNQLQQHLTITRTLRLHTILNG